MVEELEPLLERGEKIDTVTGIEFWFTPPASAGQKRAPPHKQFLVTLSVIYPLTLVVPWALRPLGDVLPALQHVLLGRLLVAVVIVWLMTYVVMPRYTRLLSRWLYR